MALHCRAGLGRTGMMLACCLVNDGLEAEAAIAAVRRICIHHIQNSTQEDFVRHYAEFLAGGTREQESGTARLPPLRLPQSESVP